MKKVAFILMLLSVGSKCLGFLRDIALANYYGASNISDAYLVSQLIPMSLLEFIGLGLLTGFIPIYSTIEANESVKEANLFTSKVVSLVAIFSIAFAMFGYLFTEEIVKVFAMGFEGETLALTIRYTRISLLGIYFVTLGYVYKAYLQIKDRFVIQTITSYSFNIVVIFSIIVSTKTNDIVLVVGSLLAYIVQTLIMLPLMRKEGFRYKLSFDFKDKYTKHLFALATPMILGISVNQINVVVDRTLASSISVGGISALNYAFRLNTFVQGIFVLSIVTVMYPKISKLVHENNIDSLKAILGQVINVVCIFLIPMTVGAIIFSEQIVIFLFGRGAFDNEAILMTSDAMVYYTVGMLAFGLREIISRVFYSFKDTKTPMINAIIGLIINVVLNLILSKFLGIGGLALATSIAAIFTTSLLLISLRKKIGPFGMKQIIISFLKVLFASFIMSGFAKLSLYYLTASLSQNISLLLAISVGAVSYFVIIYFMKIEDIDFIVGAIKKKVERGSV